MRSSESGSGVVGVLGKLFWNMAMARVTASEIGTAEWKGKDMATSAH